MPLEHALLVSLGEQAGAGSDLVRRFDRSIGYFWAATHQQIYRVLGRMERDGWVAATVVPQSGAPGKKVYAVTAAGRAEVARWLAEPLAREQHRSELAVKLRGASLGDRAALLDEVEELRAEHRTRRRLYEELEARDHPDPAALRGADLDRWLVLRGGIRFEQFWSDWLGECLAAHGRTPR